MMPHDTIIRMIEEVAPVSLPVTPALNLYTDLHLDSLAFIHLLLSLEETFAITFSLLEMEGCLEVGRLIRLTQQKFEEVSDDTRTAKRPGEPA